MLISILAVNHRNGVKDGKPWEIHSAQCVADLGPKQGVSVFTLRLSAEVANIQPGKYKAEFGGYVKDGQFVPRVVDFKPA